MRASSGTAPLRDHTVIDTGHHRLSIGTIRVASANDAVGRPRRPARPTKSRYPHPTRRGEIDFRPKVSHRLRRSARDETRAPTLSLRGAGGRRGNLVVAESRPSRLLCFAGNDDKSEPARSRHLVSPYCLSGHKPGMANSCRRPRESGRPGRALASRPLDSRFRGNDGGV